jgi:flagellar export protein FliJ
MKAFRHTLAALLTLRERAEQKALERYASALHERRNALGTLHAVEREQNAWRGQWRAALSQGCSAGSIEQWRGSERSLLEQQERATRALALAESNLAQSFQAVLLARRDREALEQHLKRQRVVYQRALLHCEQNESDELAQRPGRSGLNRAFTAQP